MGQGYFIHAGYLTLNYITHGLRYANLIAADNLISEIRRSELSPLGGSLTSLSLAGNALTSVPEEIFWDLKRLESLDLSRNNIIQIHSMAFQNGVSHIVI